MKKVLSLVAVAGMFAFASCGPSAEEKAAKEAAEQQRIADSISAAEAAAAEAAAAAAPVDSAAAPAAEAAAPAAEQAHH